MAEVSVWRGRSRRTDCRRNKNFLKINAPHFPQIALDWIVISRVAGLLESINKTCSIIQENS